jgi:hypothetical protein
MGRERKAKEGGKTYLAVEIGEHVEPFLEL